MTPSPDDRSSPGPLVSVVIPTHNRSARLARLLWSLTKQTLGTGQFEVIPVDDCSSDDTQEVLSRLAGELPYRLHPLRTPDNRGPGPARNIGWKAARAPVVAFTDDDCLPEPDWLETGLAAMNADSRLGLVQGRTQPEDIDALYADRWNHCVIIDKPNPYFETCNIFYRRQALEETGGFGEHYNWWGGWYCEDTYAGWRALSGGWSRAFTEEAVVTHDVEVRSLKWWINKSLVLCNEVAVAKQFPGYRQEAFWRPWAPRASDAAFMLGAGGLVLAIRWKPAAALAIPYMRMRRPRLSQGQILRRGVETVVVDGARAIGLLYGSLTQRILVI